MDSIGLNASDQGTEGTPQSMLGPLLVGKDNGSKSVERRHELDEHDMRIDQALAEQRLQLEREKTAYEKKRQEYDEWRLLRDAQMAEVMKQTLTTLTQVSDLLRGV